MSNSGVCKKASAAPHPCKACQGRHAAGHLGCPGHKTAASAFDVFFAGEKVRPDYEYASPDIHESERAALFQVANLDALVRMKLIAYRRKDQVHLLDLIGVGLLDATWPARLPPPLGARLQQLLDDPDG